MKKRNAFYWTDMAAWIAANDNPADLEIESIQDLISVCMVSDLSGIDRKQIAEQVVFFRKQWASVRALPVQQLP